MHKTVVFNEYSYYNNGMKYCLVINHSKPLAEAFAKEFSAEIQARGSSFYAFDGAILDGTDYAVVFGGDGTILKFIRSTHPQVPVLGINCGKMGFLAESGKTASEYLDDLANKNYELDRRYFLKIRIGSEVHYALNEAVIGRGDTINLMDVQVFTQGGSLDRYRADGVILATPTGSTAYSLSAGGPVLSPKVPAFVVTPICPHSLQSRPIVLPNEETVTIKAATAGKCVIVVDGITVYSQEKEVEVSVTGGTDSVSFVRIDKRSFYSIMLSKFTKGK